MPQMLARLTPHTVAVPRRVVQQPVEDAAPQLTNREKAAIIVRLLLAEGSPLPLTSLPEHMQAALTEQLATMRLVDRATVQGVVSEFIEQLETVGLSFPGGLEGALSMLDGHISPSAATRLRRLAGASGKVDPWERITPLSVERLLPVVEDEAVEISAVLLSKLPVSKASDLLARLSGDKARRIAHAVSRTANIDPDTVRRIGLALATQLDAQPPRAFDAMPAERMGAILNAAAADMRDNLLQELEQDDQGFAAAVRRAIFTFAHIPERVQPRDVPRLLRAVDQQTLILALAAATGPLAAVTEFLLSHVSQRMAQTLRDEIEAQGPVRDKAGDLAQTQFVEGIRQLEAQGEIRLRQEDED